MNEETSTKVKMGDMPVKLSEGEWWLLDREGNLIPKDQISNEMIEMYDLLNKGAERK